MVPLSRLEVTFISLGELQAINICLLKTFYNKQVAGAKYMKKLCLKCIANDIIFKNKLNYVNKGKQNKNKTSNL